MKGINKQEWQALPEQAQREIYDFFLLVKQQYAKDKKHTQPDLDHASQISKLLEDRVETVLFSNHSANLVEDWLDDEEDEVWR